MWVGLKGKTQQFVAPKNDSQEQKQTLA
jgi:hypothetical protein